MLSAINKLGWLFLISTYPTFQKLETLPSITLFLLYRLYEENNPCSFFTSQLVFNFEQMNYWTEITR